MSRARSFVSFLAGIPSFLRPPTTLEQASEWIRRRLTERESRFVDFAERCIYRGPSNPYLRLLQAARCELGDLRRSVERDGLERTLARLRESGVFVSFEEFKGRRPLVRDGLTLETTPQDFDMPGLGGAFASSSGGSSGAPVRLSISIDRLRADLAIRMCGEAASGILGLPRALWWQLLPAPPGVVSLLHSAASANPPQRWFFPPLHRGFVWNARARLATEVVRAAVRVAGVRAPRLEPLPLRDAIEVARWAADSLRTGTGCVVNTGVTGAVRVATAARESAIDLTGATFVVAGEPVTPARGRQIRSCGANALPLYFISEAGLVGVSCANPQGDNDLHFGSDRFALVGAPVRSGEGWGESLFVTTLDPGSPKMMLNVDVGDFAMVEKRSCGCDLESAGLDLHLRDVSSVRKLTGEGVTLVATDLTHILEEVLPSRFGGTALDYQLVEEEEEGVSRLTLIVSPGVKVQDEGDFIRVLFSSLAPGDAARDIRALWSEAGTMRVRRARPMMTTRGKQLPIVFTRQRDQADH